jgi:hypothetical protein
MDWGILMIYQQAGNKRMHQCKRRTDYKKTFLHWFLAFCLISLILSACGSSDHCHGSGNANPTLRVLFIGNSFTYANDLPGTFSKLACSGGHQVITGIAAEGGYTLANHLESSKTLDAIQKQPWNIVVLQEQSELPAFESSRQQYTYPAARILVGKIMAVDAEPVFFQTWGYRDGDPDYGISDYDTMQAALDAGYDGIANELHVRVVRVGDAWKEVHHQPQLLNLWQSDGMHPNKEGTYLAACVFYTTLFNQTPEGLDYRGEISLANAQVLQTVAAKTIPVGATQNK